ncbi:30S ribosomal protein S18 [Raphidocelis subcapitata]|uniref:Small ribosomal subunit protein bS18c n=1 Tax=Raphidocelis subcapitata TaxID=307507 RepID=A0A2V0NZZ7_9CHLO|nr:30S ribosomal protein S18 [Raphidocelis subcapitata]|eukprot:GBF93198.1 30S ribosomal protein S18 [Raphidocelis subcapitata]
MLARLAQAQAARGLACVLERAAASDSCWVATARGFSSSGGAGSGADGGGDSGDSLADDFKRRVAGLAQAPGAPAPPPFGHSRATAAATAAAAAAADAGGASTSGGGGGGGGGGGHGPPGAGAGAAPPQPRGGPHPRYGYAVLGGVNPETADEEAGAQQPTLHPQRSFRPGDTYAPEDLAPLGVGGGGGIFIPMRRPGAPPPHRPGATAEEVREGLDFRNTALLRHFVSDSGRLRPRRQTRLPRGLQRRVAKAVKLARQMALMPFEMVVGDAEADARSRMAEYEAARRGGGLRAGVAAAGRGGGRGGARGRRRDAGGPA